MSFLSGNTILFISVKPKYVEKILKGEKTVELRKSFPNKVKKGDVIFIYSTAPEKELKCICELDEIIFTSPAKLWTQVNKVAGVSREEFEEYYQCNETAYAIHIKNIERLQTPIKLSTLKEVIPNFTPPQTYKYLNSSEISSFNEKELIVAS